MEFYAVNSNYAEETLESDHYSRKLKADLFIDDRNLGGLPEWGMIYRMIHDKWGYEDIYQSSDNKEENKKRSFWKILFPRCRIPASECSDTGGKPIRKLMLDQR